MMNEQIAKAVGTEKSRSFATEPEAVVILANLVPRANPAPIAVLVAERRNAKLHISLQPMGPNRRCNLEIM